MPHIQVASRTFRASTMVRQVAEASLRAPLLAPEPGMISLAVGEPDFTTPAEIVESAAAALREGYTHYADQGGDPDLRAALAESLGPRGDSAFDPDQILVTHGGTGGLAAVTFGLVGPGDRVVLSDPSYSLYADLVRFCGGRPVLVPTGPDLHWDLDALRDALRGARMFVFCNPCNPTGVVHTADELAAVAGFLEGTDTVVIADEAYDAIVYPGVTFVSALDIDLLRPRLIYCQTFSKTYAMTGWRIGYLAGPREAIVHASRAHRTLNGSVHSATQRAALTAVRGGMSLVRPMLDVYAERRTFVSERLRTIEGLSAAPPDGTFYVFGRYDVDLPSTTVAAELRRYGVAVRAGSEFGPGGDGHIRLSFAAATDVLDEGLDRLERAFRDLNQGLT